jgi:hypothetical protein
MNSLTEGLIYALGFIGLAGIGLFPLRAIVVCKDWIAFGVKSNGKWMSLAWIIITVFTSLVVHIEVTHKIFNCLTTPKCGPSIAAGWVNLAIFGGTYSAFEGLNLARRTILNLLNSSEKENSN